MPAAPQPHSSDSSDVVLRPGPTDLPGPLRDPDPVEDDASGRTPGHLQPGGVAASPSLRVTVRPDATAMLRVNGTDYRCAAATPYQLRMGVIARCVTIATAVSRPVRLHVRDGSTTQVLAVRPEGTVQTLNADGTVDPATGIAVDESPCRRCHLVQPVTTTTCAVCSTLEPHRVELTGVAIQDAASLAHPDDVPPAPRVEVKAPDEAPGHRTGRPGLRLVFSTQEPVTLHENASIGRNPTAVEGRVAVQVTSPSKLVSRTHLHVDLDASDTILVTDQSSANGTSLQTDPLVHLTPGRPYPITPGTTLLLGDVTCTITIAD